MRHAVCVEGTAVVLAQGARGARPMLISESETNLELRGGFGKSVIDLMHVRVARSRALCLKIVLLRVVDSSGWRMMNQR